MQYLNKTFSVSLGGKAYSDGWERTFGKGPEDGSETKPEAPEAPLEPTATETPTDPDEIPPDAPDAA